MLTMLIGGFMIGFAWSIVSPIIDWSETRVNPHVDDLLATMR